MKKLFKKHIGESGSFRRNSLIMSSGAIINIIIAFVFTPIVTRIYDKEEFGIYYIFVSVITISTVIINGMYPHALVVPKFKKDFLSLLKLCFVMTFVGVAVFTFCIFLGGNWFLSLINGKEIGSYLYLLPISLLLSALNVIFINWNVRKKEFKKNASSTVFRSVSGKGVQIVYGTLISSSFPGLIYADIIAKLLGIVILGTRNMSTTFWLLLRIRYVDVKKVAIEYYKYPTYILGSNFINRITSDIPLYLISSYFGLEAVGAFGFANNMLNIPYNVIGSSIAPVYYQRAIELHHLDPKALQQFTLKSYNKMLFLGCLAFGFIFAFGDVVFGLVFSSEWELAGKMAMLLSIYFVFKLISSPFARIFRVVRKEEITLKINILLSSLRVVGIAFGVLSGSVLVAVGFFSGANLVGYAYNNFQVFRVLDIDKWIILKKTIKVMIPIFSTYFCLRLLYDYSINW